MDSNSRFDDPDVKGSSSPVLAASTTSVSVDDALPLVTDAKGLHMNEQRNKTMIKNEFQHRLILSTLLITLITLNLIIMLATVLDYLYGSSGGVINVFTVSVAVMEIIAVAVVYTVSKRISFHIAGPVYAIERTLGFMRDGDISHRLTLRDGDHFEEVADAVNAVLESYRERIGRMQELMSQGHLNDEQQRELAELVRWFKTTKDEQG